MCPSHTDLQASLHQLIGHPVKEGVGHLPFKRVLTDTYECQKTNCGHMKEIAAFLVARKGEVRLMEGLLSGHRWCSPDL